MSRFILNCLSIFHAASLFQQLNPLERFIPFGETMPQCCLAQGKGWHGLAAADVVTIVVLLLLEKRTIFKFVGGRSWLSQPQVKWNCDSEAGWWLTSRLVSRIMTKGFGLTMTCSGNLVERLPFKNLGQSKLGRKGGKTPNGQRSGIPYKFETP